MRPYFTAAPVFPVRRRDGSRILSMLVLAISELPVLVSPEDFGRVRPKVVVDMRDPEEYKEAHIPGAVNLPVDAFLVAVDSVPFHMPEFDTLVERIAALGVRQGESVLIYASARLPYYYLNVAALYMVLKHLGFKRVFVLNGGFEAWEEAGKPVSDRKGLRGRIRLKARPDSSFIVGIDSLVVGDSTGKGPRKDLHLVDLRVPGYYFGVMAPPFCRRVGHLPGARSLPFTFFMRRIRGKERSYYVIADTATVDSILRPNLDPVKLNVFYGNTPREAAFALLLLDYVGYPRKRYRLYLNGFPEWSRRKELPLVKYRWE